VTRRFRPIASVLAVAAVLSAAVVAVPGTAGADEQDPVHLSAGQKFEYTSTRPTVGSGAGVSLIFTPDQCSAPPHSATCDVFPLQLERDTREEATNFVLMQLSWDGGATFPDLVLAVAGLGLGTSTDYNLYVWEKDESGKWARRGDLSGGFSDPEMLGFLATKDEYAITVQNSQGPSLGYDLSIAFSNEIFESPFESLDPALRDPGGGGAGFTAPTDRSDEGPAPAADVIVVEEPAALDLPADAVSTDLASPALAPVAADTDFAGFRGSVDDALEGEVATFQRAVATTPPRPDPPSAAVLLFWLLALPMVLLLVIAAWFRRRRPAALAG
jgi:hypothetical protein